MNTLTPKNRVKSVFDGLFSTTQQACFSFYGHQFYDCKKKKVPNLIHKWLTPRSIAYWYMDDGEQRWKGKPLGVRFCTENFLYKDVLRLAHVLSDKYSLKTSLQKRGPGWRISISSSSYKMLRKEISSYFVKSMVHKSPEKVTQI